MRVPRTFAFVDLSGFTSYTAHHGDDEAVAVLSRFRAAVRDAGSDFGVRVAKWLGDGAMLVSVDGTSLVAAVMELGERLAAEGNPLPLRAGLAAGDVILFEGDDYAGNAVNMAARLCDVADEYEVLATEEIRPLVPPGVVAEEAGEFEVRGLREPLPVIRLRATGGTHPSEQAVASAP